MPKIKARRVNIKDEESVVSDVESGTEPSLDESETHSSSDTESTTTETKCQPKIRFRSTPLREKSGKSLKLSAREASSTSLVGIDRHRDQEVMRPRSARRELQAATSSTRSASTGSECSLGSAERHTGSDIDEHEPVAQEDLLSRISSAIPDLHMLLDKYKATHGELSHRDQLRRQNEEQSAELVRSKESIINALMVQLEDAARKRADEAGKFRSRIAGLEMSNTQLQDQAHAADNRAMTMEGHLQRSLQINEDLAIEKTMIIRRATDERERAVRRLEKDLNAKHEQKMADLSAKQEQKMADLKAKHAQKIGELNAKIAELNTWHEQKMGETRKELETQIAETMEKHSTELITTKTVLETKLEKAEVDIKELGETESELRTRFGIEFKLKEDELVTKHQEEIDKLKQEHKDYCNDQIRGFLSLQESLNKTLTEENSVLKALILEYKTGELTAKVEDVAD